MTRVVRIAMRILAILHAAFVGFTSLVGAFADGADVWSRIVVVLIHPLAAAALLLLVFRPMATRKGVLAIAAFLLATVAADLSLAAAIAGGGMKGDWELALAFAVVPTLGLLYALFTALTSARQSSR